MNLPFMSFMDDWLYLSLCNRMLLARCIPRKLYEAEGNFQVSIALETNMHVIFSFVVLLLFHFQHV